MPKPKGLTQLLVGFNSRSRSEVSCRVGAAGPVEKSCRDTVMLSQGHERQHFWRRPICNFFVTLHLRQTVQERVKQTGAKPARILRQMEAAFICKSKKVCQHENLSANLIPIRPVDGRCTSVTS